MDPTIAAAKAAAHAKPAAVQWTATLTRHVLDAYVQVGGL